MQTYYFTYGLSKNHPYRGGWTEITAPDAPSACALFRAIHPDVVEGILNCAFVYAEEAFQKTEMSKKGNFKCRCHERVTVTRVVND